MEDQRKTRDIYNTLLSNYISYDRLYEMSTKALYGGRDQFGELNFFIDLNSYFKQVWLPMEYGYKAENVLAASVINACAHYREYFWSRHRVKTNIFLVWGYNCPTELPPEYNAHFRERVATNQRARELVEKNLEILRVLCPYLPEIYFLDGGEHEVAGVIYTLASDARLNVILSKDVYTYQLVAHCPNTFIFRPMKTNYMGAMADTSWVVTKTNLCKAYRKDLKIAVKPDVLEKPSDIYYVQALGGLKARHIKGDMVFNRAIEVIADIECHTPEQLNDIQTFVYSMIYNPIDQVKGIAFNKDAVPVRADMLDVRKAAARFTASVKYPEALNSILDLYDPDGIKEIASKEYIAYPINIYDL